MPIPRNALAKNTNTHRKNMANKEIDKRVNDLKTVCENNKVSNLTFKSCKLATGDGKVSFIDYDFIKGNMKCGVMVIKAKTISQSADAIYDIVEIEKNKKEADEKKHKDD